MKRRADQGWMWADACALVDEAERLHRRFFNLLAGPAAQPYWEPPANVFRTRERWAVVVALPGAEADQVSIDIRDGGVEIGARVAPPSPGFEAGIERLEIPYGLMRRRIELPPGRYVLTEHRLANGCLYLQLTEVHR
ncbi:MAG: Hsp20/alpha crystallin family protein [Proteobacteria bacterium]|nr:Hsp20/alpha crystallin family protein [Pseudomonadota bacterium]